MTLGAEIQGESAHQKTFDNKLEDLASHDVRVLNLCQINSDCAYGILVWN